MPRFARLLPAAALAASLAACSDGNSPGNVNPAALQAEMDELASIFENNAAFGSLTVLSAHFPSYGGTALLDAAPVAGTAAQRIAALRRLAHRAAARPQMSLLSDIQALFPANVLGKTLEWDAQSGTYVIGQQTGAPANGIRILIYVVNSAATGPAVPLQQLGYVELTDQSTPQFDRLGVLLRMLGQTLADYDVTRTVGTSDTEVRAVGRLTAVDLERHADFDLVAGATNDETAFTLSQDITGSDGTHLLLELGGTEIFAEFRILIGADGSELEMNATDNGTNVNGEILYNGFQVGTISGPSEDPVFSGANGRELPANELAALSSIFFGATFFALLLTVGILAPAAVVFGPPPA